MQFNQNRNKKIQKTSNIMVISSQSQNQQEKNQQKITGKVNKMQNSQFVGEDSTHEIPKLRSFNKSTLQKTSEIMQLDIPKKKIKLNEDNDREAEIIRFDSLKNEDEQDDLNHQDMSFRQKRKMIKATPWLSNKTKQIQDACLRFHNQVVQFYEYIKPSKKQHEKRLSVYKLVNELIQQKYPHAEVLYFGSFATKLYLPDGDIDITVKIDVENDWEQTKIYDNIHKIIRKCEGSIFIDIEYIRKSKVPLIKFVHAETGLQFDISINKLDGVKQIQHVERMKKLYPEFQPLVFVFKCMLKIRNLSQTYTGGIGSFLLFCMILHFLRYVHKKRCYYTLGELVLKFMQYYSITGDWQRIAVYVADGTEIGRARQPGTLSFYSPQDDSHDIGKSAFKIRDSFNMFKNRFRVILGKNFKEKQSILKQLINPQLEQFRYYRYEKEQNKQAN